LFVAVIWYAKGVPAVVEIDKEGLNAYRDP
jgi:hypothetical protein